MKHLTRSDKMPIYIRLRITITSNRNNITGCTVNSPPTPKVNPPASFFFEINNK